MKTFLALMILLGSPLFAHAQGDDSLDLDLDPVAGDELKPEIPQAAKTPTPSIKSDARQNRSIYILNQASSGAKSGSGAAAATKTEQIDTSIIGNRADEMKKNRQRAEVETELKATEKIEESRLNDERRRNDTLFGDRFKDLERSGAQAPTATPAPAPTPIYIPVPQVQPHVLNDEDHEDFKSAHKSKDSHRKAVSTPTSTSSYVIGLIGLTEFPKADNIQGNGLFGLGLGMEVNERLLVEGMFQYASFDSGYPIASSIDEYTGSGALKIQFSHSSIRPIAGGVLSYSYRTYNSNLGTYQGQLSHSTALDAGVLGGAQFSVSDDFAVGAEFRYMWNMTSKTDGFYTSMFPNQQPLDSFSHYIFGITGRFTF